MALKESDFTGPWTHPDTGCKYASFGAWFEGEAPISRNYAWITLEMRERWGDMLAAQLLEQTYFHRMYIDADRG